MQAEQRPISALLMVEMATDFTLVQLFIPINTLVGVHGFPKVKDAAFAWNRLI